MIDPGQVAPPELALQANADALRLLNEMVPRNLIAAAQWLRDNPPTAEAVASLAFIAHEALKSAEASARAKLPRKRAPSHRSLTIEAMRAAGVETLDAFLESASVGSVEGLAIEHDAFIDRWIVEHDDLKDAKKVARSTLAEWWTDSRGSGIAR